LRSIFIKRENDPLRDPVTAVDAGKDIDQDGLNLVIGEHEIKGLGDPFGCSPATDIEEIGRFPARVLDHIHGRHGEAHSIDDTTDVAIQTDIT
jgi:hypothetical protein